MWGPTKCLWWLSVLLFLSEILTGALTGCCSTQQFQETRNFKGDQKEENKQRFISTLKKKKKRVRPGEPLSVGSGFPGYISSSVLLSSYLYWPFNICIKFSVTWNNVQYPEKERKINAKQPQNNPWALRNWMKLSFFCLMEYLKKKPKHLCKYYQTS